MGDLLEFIQNLTGRVVALAWALFILSWSIGWTLRGAPIPFSRLKRVGNSLIEDSVWAAFWLAVGTTIFSLILYIAQNVIGGS